MTNTQTLLDKIEKLMALSQSSNPHEAAAALSKAQALMAEHNLTETHLKQNQLGEAKIKSTQSVSKAKDWEAALMNMIAKSFGCRVIWAPGVSWADDYWGRYRFIGLKTQVTMAEYAGTVLLRQLVKERNAFSKKLTGQGFYGKDKTAQLDGFCKGWIAAVNSKVVALANDQEVDDLINDKVEEITKGRKAEAKNRGNGHLGNAAGFEAGKGIDLHRPMNAGEAQKQLG